MKVGILGGGQLALLLSQAGKSLNLEFRIYDPSADAPAASSGEFVQGQFEDLGALRKFAQNLECATLEWENVPAASVKEVQENVPFFFPSAAVIAELQDRASQKKLLASLGISTALFHEVSNLEDLNRALIYVGTPSVLKLCRHGYDGKGQVTAKTDVEALAGWKSLGEKPCIFEKWIAFDREVSLVFARNEKNEFCFYPLVQNDHRDGILRVTRAPAPQIPASVQIIAEATAKKIAEKLNYVGVMAIEFFLVKDFLTVNEIAPRVHNSGHWTIEGAECSQFENHLRAGLKLPFGSTQAKGFSAMINILGSLPDARAKRELNAIPSTYLHLYGKSARPGRKLGHFTLVASSEEKLMPRLHAALKLLHV